MVRYLKQTDLLAEGDAYHHFGRGANALWLSVPRKHWGKRKREVFSHTTRVRREGELGSPSDGDLPNNATVDAS